MDGFNEDDTIPSFNTSELIEEIENEDDIDEKEEETQYEDQNEDGLEDENEDDNGDDGENEDVKDEDDDEDDDMGSSLDSLEERYRKTKRFKKMTPDENSFKTKVLNALIKSCKVSGDFAVSGKLECTPLIAISLKNNADHSNSECIKFPLHEDEVSKMLKFFEQSPYGKGTETIVDTSVRNSYQLSTDRFEILNPDWDKFIKAVLVAQIKKKMSLKCSFVPSLHKLLLYTPGSFFKAHRDSEKEENMFGTLVVQLPSSFKGGQLVVRHDAKTKVFDFSSTGSINNSFATFFSVFYCDCEHEILPVTEGYRLCVVYNLIATDTAAPCAPRNHASEMELIGLLQNWRDPKKLVYALAHKYSQSNLSFKSLKTTDKIVADILKRVSNACDLSIYLGLLEKDCNGTNNEDEDYYGCHGCASDFDEDNSDNEVSYELKELISVLDNEEIVLSVLNVDVTDEVIPDHCFDNIKPYQKDCEHTGNEGVQISKSYRCAAITFWPKKFTIPVLIASEASQNLVDNVFLKEAEKYFDSGCSVKTKARIIEWANFVVDQIRYCPSKANSVAIIDIIVRFNNLKLMQNLIRRVVFQFPESFPLIIAECEKYGWEHFSTATVHMFKELSRNHAITFLTLLFGNGNLNQEKYKVFLDLLQVTSGKGDYLRFRYSSSKIQQQQEDKKVLEPFVNALLRLNDSELMKQIITNLITIHSDTILLVATICDKFGWEPFALIIANKFEKLSKKDAIIAVTLLIQNGILNEDKKKLCLSLFKIISDKNDHLIEVTPYSYHRVSSGEEIIKKRKEEKELLEPLINAASKFSDLNLLQILFQRIVPLHSETIPSLIGQCKIYGWKAFTAEIVKMFQKLCQKEAIEILSLLMENGNLKEEKKLCFDLFQMILAKNDALPLRSNNFRPISLEEKLKHQKEEQDVLYSICRMAENIRFNIISFAKTKSFKDFVPVLIRLVPKNATCLNTFWGTVALHFISQMGSESIKSIDMSWNRNANLENVCCNDCTALNNFLCSNNQSQAFKIGENRRKHLQQRVNSMEKMAHRTEIGGRGQVGVLIITKTEMGGVEALRNRNLSQTLLAKLRSVMPY